MLPYFEHTSLELPLCEACRINTWMKHRNLSRKVPYYSNSVAAFNILLFAAGDVESNPGDVKLKCSECQRTIAWNHRVISCDTCGSKFHIKCGNISVKQYKVLTATKTLHQWTCTLCVLSSLPFASLADEVRF